MSKSVLICSYWLLKKKKHNLLSANFIKSSSNKVEDAAFVFFGGARVAWHIAGAARPRLPFAGGWLQSGAAAKRRWALTASHLTEPSELVSWWPRRISDSRLISISADFARVDRCDCTNWILASRGRKHIHSWNPGGSFLRSFMHAVAFLLSYQVTITGYHPSIRARPRVR